MLTITAVSAGSVEYLLAGSGCAEDEHATAGERAASSLGARYLVDGAEPEAAGVWAGECAAMVGIAAGSPAAPEDVRAVFGALIHPTSDLDDPVFLGPRPRRYKSLAERVASALAAEPGASAERARELRNAATAGGRKAVAYYDLTFSPAKSVSVCYAALLHAGRHREAGEVVAAHRAAVGRAMGWASGQAAFCRTGYHGKACDGRTVGVYEKASGLVWTRWDHGTNRAGEPQLHSHVAVLNRVISGVDGRIHALHGRGFAPLKHGIDAIYRRALERELAERVGVVFAQRPDGKAREILGVDRRLCAEASSRAAQVEANLAEALAQFEARYGHPPSPAQRKNLWATAKLHQRPRKARDAGSAEQIAAWCAPRSGRLRASLADVDAHASERGMPGDQRPHRSPGEWEELLAGAVAAVQDRYAFWTVGNLIEAIAARLDQVGEVGGAEAELAAAVLADRARYGIECVSAPDPGPVPAVLRRPDGLCRYRAPHHQQFATTDQLATETKIVARAARGGAPALDAEGLAEAGLCAAGLGADQRAAVLGVLGSGRGADVLIGPAGTGKSRTLAALTSAWESLIGGRVLGLATSEAATQVLRAEGIRSVNTTVFLRHAAPDRDGLVGYRVAPGDLVIVDEAGMSSTAELDQISKVVTAGGGKLLFTGDTEQLTSVGAGGMLALLVTDHGAFELEQVHRFDSEWERAGSVRLRAGDPSVLDVYEDHARITGGCAEQMAMAAMRSWLADEIAGKESVLIVRSNAQAAELAGQLRAELIHHGRVQPAVLARLADGNPIGVGDRIQARRNDPSIPVHGPGMVTNRATYTVLAQDPNSGVIRVRGADGLLADLPPSYVAEHVSLAYAATAHATQGRSTDTSHTLIEPTFSRRDVYTPATRGRECNRLYVICRAEPDEHHPEALDTSPREVLTTILARDDGAYVSAAELRRRVGEEAARSLAEVGTQWDLLAGEYARDRHTDALATALPAPFDMDRVLAEAGYPRLMTTVRAGELTGHDATALITEAIGQRSLFGADSICDVLAWRIHTAVLPHRAPERDVAAGDWTSLAPPMPGPIGDYLHVLATAASARQSELGQRAAVEQPAWATEYLGAAPAEPGQRGEWVHRAGIVAAYRELHAIGEHQLSIGQAPGPARPLHRLLWQHAHRALGAPADALDYTSATDAELTEMRQVWEREQTWAPYYVADELAAARAGAHDYHNDATLWAGEAQLLPAGSAQRRQAQAEHTAAAELAATYTARAHALAEIHQARAEWDQRTRPLAERARHASDELRRRGHTLDDPPQPEQLALLEVGQRRVHGAEAARRPGTGATTHSGAGPGGGRERDAACGDRWHTAAPVQAHLQQRTQAAGELALFGAIRTPVATALAEPLRATGGGAQTNDGFAVMLGQARRHSEILHALRTQRAAASSAPAPVAERHANEAAAVSARMAAADRDRARHEQQLAQTRRARLSLRL